MSESNTICSACKAKISKRTADEHAGLCDLCHHKAATIPPDNIEIPHDFAEHLFAMNEDPLIYRKIAWRENADFHRGYIDKIAENNDLYQKWSPKLFEFAAQCRVDQPIPPESSLSDSDRAKQLIYEAKIKKAERLPQKQSRNKVTVCRMPLVAISVAQKLWPGENDDTVILTPEEQSKWDEIYSHPKDTFWWIIDYWWSIDDSPEQKWTFGDVAFYNWNDNEIPEGSSPWLVLSGLQWGSLFGGSDTELWLWDGSRCKFIRTTSFAQF
jgi:hypothetical protein